MPPYKTLQEAAEWFATLSADSVTDKQKSEWEQWLDKHPQNKQAWQHIEDVGQRFQTAAKFGGGYEGRKSDASRALIRSRAERLNRRSTLGIVAAICVGGLTWRTTPLRQTAENISFAWYSDYHTGIGKTRQLSLQDGGQIWLNTATAVDVSYRDSKRQVSLLTGEILIQTAIDSLSRPFYVRTAHGDLQALGTKFSVREGGDSCVLTVYEGAVRIRTNSGKTEVVNAGRHVHFNQLHIPSPCKNEKESEAWVRGLIVANNISLKELITDINRYQYTQFTVSPEIESLPVIGTYPTDKPEVFLTMLERALPLRVNRILPWWISLEPQN